jgi:hypothetical protein
MFDKIFSQRNLCFFILCFLMSIIPTFSHAVLPPLSPAGGNYLSLNGKDEYVTLDFGILGALFEKGTKELTVEAWIYPTLIPDKDNVAVILSQHVLIYIAGNGHPYYQDAKKWINLNNDDLVLMMFAYTGIESSTGTMYLALSRYKWHHIAFQARDRQTAWICDNISSSLPQVIGLIADDLSKIADIPSKDFVLGGYGRKIVAPFINWGSFAGYIDEVRISNVPRYDIDKLIIPQGRFVPDANTIALWHFDEPYTAKKFRDSSIHGYDLTGMNDVKVGPFAVNENNRLATTWANIKVENGK